MNAGRLRVQRCPCGCKQWEVRAHWPVPAPTWPTWREAYDAAVGLTTPRPGTCQECGAPREVPGEGRYCSVCEDYEGTCSNDHCMTCGHST